MEKEEAAGLRCGRISTRPKRVRVLHAPHLEHEGALPTLEQFTAESVAGTMRVLRANQRQVEEPLFYNNNLRNITQDGNYKNPMKEPGGSFDINTKKNQPAGSKDARES